MTVDVYAVSHTECADAYPNGWVHEPSMFCAADFKKDSCFGDSGGPILDESGVQIGTVSWGRGYVATVSA